MRVLTGRVVAGRIEVDDPLPPEGSVVTIYATDDSRPFTVTPAEEAALLKSIAEADRGDVVPANELLKELATDP